MALACIVLVAAVIGIWARRNIEEPAVQEALAARLTEQVMVLVDPEALFE